MRLKHVLPLLAVLLASPALSAGPPITQTPTTAGVTGTVIQVPAGFAADLSAPVPDGGSVIWRVTPPAVWTAPNLSAGRYIFTGVPGGTYQVELMTITIVPGGSESQPGVKAETSTSTVQFGGTLPPGPFVPPQPPTPVIPADLLAAVTTAYQSEPAATRAADALALAGAYRTTAVQAASPTVTTRKQLIAAGNAEVTRLIDGRLTAVRRAVGDYLNATVGRSDVALDAALRAAYAKAMADAAAAVSTLKYCPAPSAPHSPNREVRQ